MRRRPSLRTRLLLAFVLLVAGALVLAGSLTYVLTRGTAVEAAKDNLGDDAEVVVAEAKALRNWVRRIVSRGDGAQDGNQTDGDQAGAEQRRAGEELQLYITQVRRLLRLTDARVVFLDSDGSVLSGADMNNSRLLTGENTPFAMPPRLEPSDLQVDRLLAGETVVGEKGSIVFLARPVEGVSEPARETPVLILTQTVDANVLGRAAPAFLVAAGVAMLVCVAVSLWLVRRMTRPLRRVQETALRLATGDLAARVDLPARTEDELASLAATLDSMAADLEQARGAERAFLLSISHDLRTPLTSIRGYAEALADGTLDDADPEARARAAAIIGAEARRLERLVRDLLDLSRLDSRNFSLRAQPCDAAEVVRDAARAFEPAAADLGLELRLGSAADPIPADLDPERLGQIVSNLVENALKYATSNVTVETRQVDHRLEMTVADDGPGIPVEEGRRVFERLYTSRPAAARSVGTGLGLAIVRELAQAMGGQARLDSTDGTTGARFVVSLPLIPQPAARR